MDSRLRQTTDQQSAANLRYCASKGRSSAEHQTDKEELKSQNLQRDCLLAACQVSFGAFSLSVTTLCSSVQFFMSPSPPCASAVWLATLRARNVCNIFIRSNKNICWMNRIVCHVVYRVKLVIRVHLAFINHLPLSLYKYDAVNIILCHRVSKKLICLQWNDDESHHNGVILIVRVCRQAIITLMPMMLTE